MKITLVTGNWAKVALAKQFLEPEGIEVDNVKMDTIEIQADTVEEVAAYSAKWASDRLKANVVKNDTGIMVDALKGFPAAVQALAYCEYGKEPVVFTSITEGEIAKRKSGKYGWAWDFIFIPKGQTKTLGCFKDEVRFSLWNDTGYKQLVEYLKNKKEK